MRPFMILFICVIGFSLMTYGTAKMRGKIYGISRRSSSSRKKQELACEQKHKDKLESRKMNPVINFWQSDFRRSNPNNCEFCHNLNATWFHSIRNRSQKMNLSKEELQKIKEMYITQVYTPQNFPITWRDISTWSDPHGITLQLQDISEEDIKKYYFDRCPRPSVHIGDVLSFLGTVAAAFSTIVLFGVMCA